LIPKAFVESGLRAPKAKTSEEEGNAKKAKAEKEAKDALAKLQKNKKNDVASEAEEIIFNAEVKMRKQKELEELQELQKKREANAIPKDIASKLTIDDSAIWSLVRWYCREAGVRNLGQKIEKICRKLALDVVRYQEGGINATETSAPKDG
jgi:ribonuclease D